MLFILDGWRGIKEGWLAALVAWVGMGTGVYLTSNFLSYELAAVVGSLQFRVAHSTSVHDRQVWE